MAIILYIKFYINFQDCKILRFAYSVRCTTQPSFISSAASQAEIAAAAGEEAKDDYHLETVSDHGGEFIPLLCESFGVWTPFALSTVFMLTGQLLREVFPGSN